MIWALFLAAGFIAGALAPDPLRDWVRGAAGKVRERVFGARPAPKPDTLMAGANAAAPAPRETGQWRAFLTGARNILDFVLGRPVLVIGLLILAVWIGFSFGCVRFPFGGSAHEARISQQAAESEADTGRFANNRADETRRHVNAAHEAAARGQQDIDNAVASLPPDVTDAHFAELDRIYRDAYLRVLNASGDASPDPGRTPPVRRPRANTA